MAATQSTLHTYVYAHTGIRTYVQKLLSSANNQTHTAHMFVTKIENVCVGGEGGTEVFMNTFVK